MEISSLLLLISLLRLFYFYCGLRKTMKIFSKWKKRRKTKESIFICSNINVHFKWEVVTFINYSPTTFIFQIIILSLPEGTLSKKINLLRKLFFSAVTVINNFLFPQGSWMNNSFRMLQKFILIHKNMFVILIGTFFLSSVYCCWA